MENLETRIGCLLAVEDFSPYVGQAFRVDATPAAVDIRLDDIQRFPAGPANQREPFTLLFSTPFSALLTDGTYPLRSPDGRGFSVHIVPTQCPPGDRRLYHAVFA